jgi:hypothetical protein
MWNAIERRKHGEPNDWVVREDDEVCGIAVCATEKDAARVASALEAQDNPVEVILEGGWNKCSEQMPDDETLVLIYTANDHMLMAAHDERGWWDRDNILITGGVTHWCDPVPPSDQEAVEA